MFRRSNTVLRCPEFLHINPMLAALRFLLLLATLSSCSTGVTVNGSNADSSNNPPDRPSLVEMQDCLYRELDRLGIDPARTAAIAPAGEANAVFDMHGEIILGDPPIIVFSWTERMLGDYNQDGLVGVSDLTPIGQSYNQTVLYDDPAAHGGIAHWPLGDPDAGGAQNWRMARVDGNDDGLIYLTDITTIAQHWEERISGYRLYFQTPSMDEFEMLPNPGDAGSPLTVPRSVADPGNPNSPFRYELSYTPPAEEGFYHFYVAPYDSSTDTEGTPSPVLTLPEEGAPPVATLAADPTAGNPPLEVTFDASGSTDADGAITKYEWDFDGDGSYDEDSGEPEATFTYTDSGSYNGTVRVTDTSFQTDTASIEIAVNTPPVAVIVADPKDALAPFESTLTVDGSYDPDGEIVLYEWDFESDGSFDDTDTEPTPRVREFNFPGEFEVALRVTDDGGLTQTETAKITPAYGEWDIQNIDMSTDAGEGCSLAVVVGVPAIAYHDRDQQRLMFVRASNTLGTGSWLAPQIVTDDLLAQAVDPSLAVISGNPAIAYYNWGESELRYVRATSETGSEWVQEPVTVHDGGNFRPSLCQVAGHPAIAFQPNSFDIYYEVAVDSTGTDWSALPRDIDEGSDDHWNPSLAVISGIPGVAYTRRDAFDNIFLMYVHATDASGANAWNTPVVAWSHGVDDTGFYPSLAELAGTPAISFAHGDIAGGTSRPYVVHSQSATGATGSWDWPGGTDLSDFREQACSQSSLAVVNGLPHVVFRDPDTGWLWHVWGQDQTAGEWVGPFLVDDGFETNDVGMYCSLADVAGHPGVAYHDDTAQNLKYAVLQ